MNVSCVTVCVNYSDFLAHTIPFNRNIFNHWVIITSPDDKDTINLCNFWGLHCIQTRVMYSGGDKFNKAKAINEGLKVLDQTPGNFLAHMDADIVLPPSTRKILENIQLDPANIYGVDRQCCRSYEDWADFMIKPIPQHIQNVFVIPNKFDLGVRIAKQEFNGFIPIGFFQLWGSDPAKNFYHEGHDSAARSDMLFSLQWERKNRVLIPELFVTHLESESNVKMGINWSGRQTKLFTADRPKSKVDQIMDKIDVKELQS